jgi:hypothetical protein
VRVGGGIAAAAVVVLAAGYLSRTPRTELQLREAPLTLIAAPLPVQPSGDVTRVVSLSWRSVPQATQYRVTLFRQDGSTAWGGETGASDTMVILPRGIGLTQGATYYWKVEARTDWNRWTSSELVEVRIEGRR